MKVEFLSHWGDDMTVVNNARVSFDKLSKWVLTNEPEVWIGEEPVFELTKTDQKLIGYLARGCTTGQWHDILEDLYEMPLSDRFIETLNYVKRMPTHWAPFANGIGARFRIKAPIPIMRHVFKHKVGSTESEVSRRYVSGTPEVFQPTFRAAAENVKQGSGEALQGQPKALADFTYNHAVEAALKGYDLLLEQGVCPEQARFILPQGAYTEAIVSNSLYGWANFYNQRSDRSHAQQEIADIADQVAVHMAKQCPVSWAALTK